jgi:hypothetical protein
MKELLQKIKNPLIRLALALISGRLSNAIARIKDETIKLAATRILELLTFYVLIFTDNDKDNLLQVRELIRDQSDRHIDVGLSLLKVGVNQINNGAARSEIIDALEFIAESIKAAEKSNPAPA